MHDGEYAPISIALDHQQREQVHPHIVARSSAGERVCMALQGPRASPWTPGWTAITYLHRIEEQNHLRAHPRIAHRPCLAAWLSRGEGMPGALHVPGPPRAQSRGRESEPASRQRSSDHQPLARSARFRAVPFPLTSPRTISACQVLTQAQRLKFLSPTRHPFTRILSPTTLLLPIPTTPPLSELAPQH